MSYDLVVYLKRKNMPTPSAWQSAIVDAGFPVVLDTDFDIDSFSGFLPCPVNHEISGFEYYPSKPSSEELSELNLASDVDFSILFCIGSRPLELVSVFAASSVLAAISGGSLSDPQSGELITPNNVVSWAKDRISAAS